MIENMNDEDIINIVDEVFEKMEVNDIEEMDGESSDEDQAYLMTMTASVMRTLRKLVRKL